MPRRASLPTALGAVPGVKIVNDSFFNEFTVRLPKPASAGGQRRWPPGASSAGVPRLAALIPDDPSVANLLLLAATETDDRARHGRCWSPASKEVL